MSTSLLSADTQKILDQAVSAGGSPSPADWRDLLIYFLMVDRFNNDNAPPVHQPFDDPNFFDFQGGKFGGIKSKLRYIKQLGAGAIWLSPVLKNLQFEGGSYHGYGIHDFLRAEPRFADNPQDADNELRELVNAAHQEGLFVIFDIVLNHTGNVFAYNGNAESSFQNTPQVVQWRDASGVAQPQFDKVENIPNPSLDAVVWPSEFQKNQYFRRQGGSSPSDDTIGDFASLKQMVTADPELQGFLIRAYQYVIARYDIDGFRIDTLRYLKGDLPRLFGNSIREFALSIGKKNFFTFGEVLDGNAEEDIARFIGRSTNDNSALVGVDAALDYPLFNTLRPTIKGFAPPSSIADMYARRKLIEKNILSSHGEATRFFVTFLDNHDMKERIRFVQPGDEHKFDDQVTLGLACLYTLPGIPCIYYGTEVGLHGSGTDPAVREALWGISPGFPKTALFYAEMQKIAGVRDAQAALRYGRFYFRQLSGDGINFGISPFRNGVLAYSRILNDQEVIVVANTGAAAESLRVIVDISLSRVGDQFKILYSNKKNPTLPGPIEQLTGVNVVEVDGGTSNGPIHSMEVTLLPFEVQIIRH